ncbi:hypothetical protein BCR37DRAFT_99839 [Protomyces lactucae-debilis]|uniref:Uncharacterized protein n=1 Tax=Protomyces lactucae-debilis TaxID=2754530 RepID=A0A1Y2F6M2_PROLT|nr:uncharacterized protein BCR37DRAFT_99839 [Protomyces lactucae-debilis]ORY78976.1 hypothetical protein BCR37DRAFT_99839 [Protomyces lactucae-debilis]
MQDQTAACYAMHFRQLFLSIEAKMPMCDFSRFANVVDFSDSQRCGFLDAFAQHMYNRQRSPEYPGVRQELAHWRSQGESILKGCSFHWQKGITKEAGKLPLDSRAAFQSLVRQLGTCSSNEDFQTIKCALESQFPTSKHYISWWTKPSTAGMIFESQKSPESAYQHQTLPETSNGVESMHARIYHAAGITSSDKKMDTIKGLEALALYANMVAKERQNWLQPHGTCRQPLQH